MKLLLVASECAPFVKTGGLADVVGALPGALAAKGAEARVLLPLYPALKARAGGARAVLDLGQLHGGPARVLALEDAREGITAFLQKCAPVWKGK